LPAEPRRILLGAFGDPGHAFPMIALGGALRARGHEVWLQTWRRWQHQVEGEGLHFAAAPEYEASSRAPGGLGFYAAAERAARDTLPLVSEVNPHAVVADILTLAPALAAELSGVPWATLVPHVYPVDAPGLPIYSIGGRLPRTFAGEALWESVKNPMRRGVEEGRRDLNSTRARLGLTPIDHPHGGISRELALVATFPQLEYPRTWPPGAHVVGPLIWEPDSPEIPLPEGDEPLVLIAPSTSQDPSQRLVRAALEGLAELPVRVLATLNRRTPGATTPIKPPKPRDPDRGGRWRRPQNQQDTGLPAPPNATVVEWLSYARTMPHCDLVVCHVGHGTLARALVSGCPVLACPIAGDMAENAARVDWSGAGVRLPRRFISRRPLRMAVERVLEDDSIRARAQQLARWAANHDSGATAAQLLEEMIERSSPVGSRVSAGASSRAS
jgi:UDP:flavonoid glycosyltransferase YjiC (YdhE family)